MKVKICGLKKQEDVEVAVRYGADYLGFVFAESHRQVTPEKVKEMTKQVPKRVKKIGVFVSPSLEEVDQTVERAGLDMIQIHGIVTKEHYCVPLIQALTVENKEIYQLAKTIETEYLLFDAPPKKYVGGNGETFDWQKLAIEKIKQKKIFIAGGLNVANVQQAKRVFCPYAVDVSSGVETNGEKNRQKMIEFLKKAKENIYV